MQMAMSTTPRPLAASRQQDLGHHMTRRWSGRRLSERRWFGRGWSGIVPAALLMAGVLSAPVRPALADSNDGARPQHPRSWVHHRLPAERHVVEKVMPPGSGVFLINGRVFTAKTSACWQWTAGDRIRLVRGDWNGYCSDAVFYNMRRGRSCAMWCG
jgi:hypothetical protein